VFAPSEWWTAQQERIRGTRPTAGSFERGFAHIAITVAMSHKQVENLRWEHLALLFGAGALTRFVAADTIAPELELHRDE
jgi:hypothetical protein